MSTIRKGTSIGPRETVDVAMIKALCTASVEEVRSVIARADKQQLIEAHRWCERDVKPHSTRKALFAAGIRKRILAEQTEAQMKSAKKTPITKRKGARR